MKKLALPCLLLFGLVFLSGSVRAVEPPGGWSASRPMNREALGVFRRAVQNDPVLRHGNKYNPTAYSIKVNEGWHYRFFCESVTSTIPPRRGTARISVTAHLGGEIELVEIEDTTRKTSAPSRANTQFHRAQYPGVGPIQRMPWRSVRKMSH